MQTKLKFLHKRYIQLTTKQALIIKKRTFIANMPKISTISISKSNRLHISTYCTKHLYDKRTAREYDFILHNIENIVTLPDTIYKDTNNRNENIIFHKILRDGDYISIIQTAKYRNNVNYVLTAYRIRRKELKKFNKVWEREAGTPPSSL